MKGIARFAARTPEQLGSVLRGFRRQRGLTQAQLGARVGLAQKAISAVESHTRSVGVEQLFKILAALEVELSVQERDPNPSSSEW